MNYEVSGSSFPEFEKESDEIGFSSREPKSLAYVKNSLSVSLSFYLWFTEESGSTLISMEFLSTVCWFKFGS